MESKKGTGTEWDNLLDIELFDPIPEVKIINKDTIRLGSGKKKKKERQMDSKNIFKSKTFWTNLALVAGAAATEAAGAQLPVDNTTALSILGLINVGLRLFTNQAVTVMPQSDESRYH